MADTISRDGTTRESHALIGSDKVEGTKVYRPDGEKIGQVERIMIDKKTGKVAYAVMSFGGFMGMGHDHYPLPWSMLNYSEKLGGYQVSITEDQLKGAPKYSQSESWDWGDRTRHERLHDYYRVPPYWGI